MRALPSRPNRCSTSAASSQMPRYRPASEKSFRALPSRAKIESATLSRQVSWSKRFTSWKLRAIPARIRPCTDSAVTSTPWNRIWPLSARSRPLIRLTRLVLPAPLEPISASTCPSRTAKSTPSTARFSPKCFVSFVVSSRLTSGGPPEPGEELARAPRNARRQREHERHQDDAKQELPVDREPDRVGLQVVEDDRADDGPAEGPEPAEHGHEDDLARERPVEDVRGREPVERHPERPREAGEHARHHERDPAVAPDLDPHELRARLVVADGLERLAKRGVHDHPHERDAGEEEDEHVGVVGVHEEGGLVLARRDRPAEQARRGHAQ